MREMIGKWAFIVGLVISIVAGIVSIGATGLAWLVALGIIAGLVNVTSKEVTGFLIATIALMMVGSVGLNLPAVGSFVTSIVSAFTALVAGAAFIVAIKEVFAITKNK